MEVLAYLLIVLAVLLVILLAVISLVPRLSLSTEYTYLCS